MSKPPQNSAARRKRAQDLKRRGLAGVAPALVQPTPPAPPKPDPVAEALEGTREQVRSVLKALVFGHEPEHVRLFCALALQELKEHEAAAVLIDKYKLQIPK